MNRHEIIDFKALNTLPHWYALKTKYHHEKKVDIRLKAKGLTSYLPLQTVYRRWSDRLKPINEPIFSCYLFVYIPLCERLKILETDGVVHLVSFNGHPSPIPEKQINSIRFIIEKIRSVKQVNFFVPGKKVRIRQGILKGIEGFLIRDNNNHRFVIAIDTINQGISIDIDANDLEAI